MKPACEPREKTNQQLAEVVLCQAELAAAPERAGDTNPAGAAGLLQPRDTNITNHPKNPFVWVVPSQTLPGSKLHNQNWPADLSPS